jgi:pyruvate dehydrogenase E1 component beta subunit
VLANHPGVKVVVPSTGYDAKGLLKSAIRDNDPVFFLENTLLYGEKSEVPDEEYLIPLGVADVKREGTDLTIVTYGRCVLHSLAAAETLEKEHDISVEVIDLRCIRPLDIDTVLKSVAKTHRVLIVEEQKPFASVGTQLTYMIQQEAFDELDAPIKRVATIDAPAIYSPPVEAEQLPNPARVIKAALAVMA